MDQALFTTESCPSACTILKTQIQNKQSGVTSDYGFLSLVFKGSAVSGKMFPIADDQKVYSVSGSIQYISNNAIRADIDLGGLDGSTNPILLTVQLKGTGAASKTAGAQDFRIQSASGESLSHKLLSLQYASGQEQYHLITMLGAVGSISDSNTNRRLEQIFTLKPGVGCWQDYCIGPKDKMIEFLGFKADQAKSQTDAAKARLGQVNADLAKCQEQGPKVEADIKALGPKIKALKSQIASIQTTLDSKQSLWTEQKQIANSVQSRYDALIAQQRDLQSATDPLKAQLASATGELAQIDNTLTDVTAKLNDAKTRAAAILKELTDLQNRLTPGTNEYTETRILKDTAAAKLKESELILQQLNSAYQEQNSQYKSKSQEIAKSAQKASDALAEVAKLEQDLHSLVSVTDMLQIHRHLQYSDYLVAFLVLVIVVSIVVAARYALAGKSWSADQSRGVR